jgi:2-polyprenyl-6-methoxyphenol hydroxylase-like FAD-dependent oxidoreductase
MGEQRGHAVVMGGSMAGLLAARVLSERFDRVSLVERDAELDGATTRKGVPQGRHAHGLLARGSDSLERLFPGLADELVAGGALRRDMLAALRWFHFGGYKLQAESGVIGLLQSRPFLERAVRRRVLALGNVSLVSGAEVEGVVPSPDRRQVVGVCLRRAGGAGEALRADLVVDATGRGSRTPRWLEALGYEAPPVDEIQIGVGYASRVYRRRAGDLPGGADALLVYPTPPLERRMAVLLPMEEDRWMLTLGGWLGDHAPTDEDGFTAFARSLPTADVQRFLEHAEPLGPIVQHRFPSNLRRRYERLRRLPAGLVVLGDAVCSFNPIYGQGMSASAIAAETLAGCLDERRPAAQLPRRFQARLAKALDAPWTLAAGEDFRYPGVTGPKPRGTDLVNRYVARVHVATQRDRRVALAFLDVMNLERPPTSLLRPALLVRVLRASRGARPSGALQTVEAAAPAVS